MSNQHERWKTKPPKTITLPGWFDAFHSFNLSRCQTLQVHVCYLHSVSFLFCWQNTVIPTYYFKRNYIQNLSFSMKICKIFPQDLIYVLKSVVDPEFSNGCANLLFGKIFAKNCMNIKRLLPPDPSMRMTSTPSFLKIIIDAFVNFVSFYQNQKPVLHKTITFNFKWYWIHFFFNNKEKTIVITKSVALCVTVCFNCSFI